MFLQVGTGGKKTVPLKIATDGIQLAELVNQLHFIGCHCHGIQIALTVKEAAARDQCTPLDLLEHQEMSSLMNIYVGGELATHRCTQSIHGSISAPL